MLWRIGEHEVRVKVGNRELFGTKEILPESLLSAVKDARELFNVSETYLVRVCKYGKLRLVDDITCFDSDGMGILPNIFARFAQLPSGIVIVNASREESIFLWKCLQLPDLLTIAAKHRDNFWWEAIGTVPSWDKTLAMSDNSVDSNTLRALQNHVEKNGSLPARVGDYYVTGVGYIDWKNAGEVTTRAQLHIGTDVLFVLLTK